MSNFQTLRLYIRLSRPILVLSVALLYTLGTGVAHYLGETIDWQDMVLGLLWVGLLQLSTHYLADYFTIQNTSRTSEYPPLAECSGALGSEKLPRQTALWAGLACLAVDASLSIILINTVGGNPTVILTMFLLFVGCLLYATPPVRLATSGYGELTIAFLAMNLTPLLAFLLQFGSMHRMVAMTTFPLTLLMLAMFVAINLRGYAADLKQQRYTLVTRLGWERAILLHNISILLAFVLIGAAPLIGFPVRLFLPCLLGLPIGIYQIGLMRGIVSGAKPNWQALMLAAIACFCVTTYLFIFTYWIS
jgi:1,4-dihydroxy-2-naphthoate octaprenyltransferase